jgi:hypothetical protein
LAFRIQNTQETPAKQGDRRVSNPANLRHEASQDDARSSEKEADSTGDDVASVATVPDGSTRSQPEPSDADLECAIVAAMLDGRGAVAELLAERLKERRHARAGVVALDARTRKR